jgi:DnaJ-domain-containing protein 1
MHPGRAQFFLLCSGVAAVAVVLFGRLFFLRRESQFRGDLWEQKKRQAATEKARQIEDAVDRKILIEHRPDPADPEPEPEPEPEPAQTKPEKTASRQEPLPFRYPNFRGAAHEVLGVEKNANAETVQRAYKFWIKRFHPDRVAHLGGTYVEQARRRAEQLNSARQELLRQRG